MSDVDSIRIIVLLGIVLQYFINRKNKKVGSIVGTLVTVTLFIWGMTVYSDSDTMMFFYIELSEPIFILICIGWLLFDIFSIYSAFTNLKISKKLDAVISTNMANAEALQNTDQPQEAIDLYKPIIMLQIKQRFVKLTKSEELPSIVMLFNLYQKLGMDASSIEKYKNEIDNFISRFPQTLKNRDEQLDFILGMDNPVQNAKTEAFRLGQDLLFYISKLPNAAYFSPQLEQQPASIQAEPEG